MPTPSSPSTGPAAPRPPIADVGSLAIVALGAIQPFAGFLAANVHNPVEPAPVARVAIVWVVLTFAAFVGVRLVTRSSPPIRTAAAFVAFTLSFWNFSRWLQTEPGSPARLLIEIALWAAVTLLVVVLAMKIADLAAAKAFLLIFLSVWVLSSLVTFGSARASTDGEPLAMASNDGSAPFRERPDVYWIVLDEHARSDQLLKWTGSDNSWFDDALHQRGFSTSDSSWSGYLFTHLSIASTWAMEYPFTPGHTYGSEYALTRPLTDGDNPVVRRFEANGYRYVYAPDGNIEWSVCPEPVGDRECLEPDGSALALHEPLSSLILGTPVGALQLPVVHRELTSVVDGARRFAHADDRPLFLMAHVLSPHAPIRYGDGCARRADAQQGNTLAADERVAAYANDVQCIDHAVVETVDQLLELDPDAVIAVQSDHGSRLTFNWDMTYEQWSSDNLSERFAAVNAIRLPEGCRGDSIEGEPLVNTFRLIFACLDGTEPDLLPTRTIFTSYRDVNEMVEVPADRLEEP